MSQGKAGTEWRERFIEVLAQNPNVGEAAAAAGICRRTAYNHRARSQEFRARWDEAVENGCDLIEHAFFNRAVHGVTKTIFYKDQPIGTETTYDTTAGIFLLKGHRPEKYRERQDVTSGGEPVTVQFYLPERDPEPQDADDPAAGGAADEVPSVDS